MKTLSSVLLTGSLLVLAPAASAATVRSDVTHRHGLTYAHTRFVAASGERNALTVERTVRGVVFRDTANRVHARGDCVRLDAHTARCPSSEDTPVARLRDRDDRAHVADVVMVDGGSGDDRLRGARESDQLVGGRGDDVLKGGRGDDSLTGGPGRDRLEGGGGDDDLIDGETDAQSARDVYRGGYSRETNGADRGDVIDYSLRHEPLRIDLRRHRSNTGDAIAGIESIVGGRGDDILEGDRDDNNLDGGRGHDILIGAAGQDILLGGRGDDEAFGGTGHDVVWGQGGVDKLVGGAGDDLMEARDGGTAEIVDCGSGRDDDVVGDRVDSLRATCERSTYQTYSRVLSVRTRPTLAPGTATFRVACLQDGPGSCDGTITIAGLDGTPYGSGSFAGLPDDPQTFSDVTVALTPAGVAAVRAGRTVQVAYGRTGGYRVFLNAGD